MGLNEEQLDKAVQYNEIQRAEKQNTSFWMCLTRFLLDVLISGPFSRKKTQLYTISLKLPNNVVIRYVKET